MKKYRLKHIWKTEYGDGDVTYEAIVEQSQPILFGLLTRRRSLNLFLFGSVPMLGHPWFERREVFEDLQSLHKALARAISIQEASDLRKRKITVTKI